VRVKAGLHGGRAQGPDQLVLQVLDADVEAQPLHFGAGEAGADPGSFESAPERFLPADVAEPGQLHARPLRAEPADEARHQVVLGLVTTKDGSLEDADHLVARMEEAVQYVPLDRLAISPQCGFASGEIARTMTPEEQEAKLRLVGQVARRIWR
jgi:Cobalamin-independent synthase, Catalytic domain